MPPGRCWHVRSAVGARVSRIRLIGRFAGPILAASVLNLTSSCAETGGTPGTVFSDSAGVSVATAEAPAWRPGEGWRFAENPVLEIGMLEGPEEYLFSDLVGAVRLSDGRIVVADRDSHDLRVFDGEGTFLFRIGGDGEGPGEFRRLEFLGAMAGDSLVTYDDALRRVQVFSPVGEFARSFVVETSRPTLVPDKVVGVVDRSTVVIRLIDATSGVSEGIQRWPHEVLTRIDLARGTTESVVYLPGAHTNVEVREEDRISQGRVMFGKENEFAAAAGRIAYLSTDTFAVHLLDPAGAPGLTIRRPVQPIEVTPEHRATYIRNNLDIAFPEGSDPDPEYERRFRQMLDGMAVLPDLPMLRSVQLDSEGNVWVEPYYILGERPLPFQVFSADGTWLGQVEMPEGFHRGYIAYQAPYYQIGSDYILGVWQDDMEVQYVRLYELIKG